MTTINVCNIGEIFIHVKSFYGILICTIVRM
jgi:hypothetical protein